MNGVSWVELADLNTARREQGGCGTVTAALAFSGEVPPNTTAAEEWSGSTTATKSVDTD